MFEQSVYWNVDVQQSSDYEVAFEYLCPEASTGAEVEVSAGTTMVRGVIHDATPMEPIVMRDVVPRSEVPKMHWKTLRPGKLRLDAGAAKITVRVVMDLNRVLLRRV